MEDLFQMNFTLQQVNTFSNLALAHVGDGVYELMCRAYLCKQGEKTVLNLHNDTIRLVQATAQARIAEKLKPYLTEAEQDLYRRGKNAHTHAAPKSASRAEYARATGLETLFGALYLMGQTQRLNELFALAVEEN